MLCYNTVFIWIRTLQNKSIFWIRPSTHPKYTLVLQCPHSAEFSIVPNHVNQITSYSCSNTNTWCLNGVIANQMNYFSQYVKHLKGLPFLYSKNFGKFNLLASLGSRTMSTSIYWDDGLLSDSHITKLSRPQGIHTKLTFLVSELLTLRARQLPGLHEDGTSNRNQTSLEHYS